MMRAVGPSADVVVRKTWGLPPTLSAQYHFAPKSQLSPYVGAGVSYMNFHSGHNYNGFDVSVKNNVGVFSVSNRGSIKLDVKKLFFRTDASINSRTLKSRVRLDPWVLSAGVSYKF